MFTQNQPDRSFSRRQFLKTATMGMGAGLLATALPNESNAQGIPSLSLDPILAPLRAQFDLPAVAGAVLSGSFVFLGAVGVRKYDTPAIKVTHDDQFHLGSCTKAMTGTLIGQLVEQGLIDWTTKVLDIFPFMRGFANPAYKDVTVDHLLAHRSGFSSAFPSEPLLQNAIALSFPPQQRYCFTQAALMQVPAVQLGQWNYSNNNYTVLGAIIENFTGLSWEMCMATRLFAPLGMTTAGFGPMGYGAPFMSQPWQHTLSGNQHTPISPSTWTDNPEVIGPAGTVHCSVLHWMRFVQEHVKGLNGKGTLMKTTTYQRLHRHMFGDGSQNSPYYAGGWGEMTTSWGNLVYNHMGSNLQNVAVVMMSPSKQFAVVTMTNQGGAEAVNACGSIANSLVTWAKNAHMI